MPVFRTTCISVRQCRRFIKSHSRLLLFLSLLLIGFVVGCMLFRVYGKAETAFLGTVLTVERLESGIRPLLAALYSSCFLPVLLLLMLFFCGLSACGLPVILTVPVFFGMGIGMSEAYYYSTGWHGVLLVAVLLLPQTVIKAIALLMASAESLRMTLCFGGQLLPQQIACGGMHKDFRLYLLRFLIFLCITLGGGILDVLLRLLCQKWLL